MITRILLGLGIGVLLTAATYGLVWWRYVRPYRHLPPQRDHEPVYEPPQERWIDRAD